MFMNNPGSALTIESTAGAPDREARNEGRIRSHHGGDPQILDRLDDSNVQVGPGTHDATIGFQPGAVGEVERGPVMSVTTAPASVAISIPAA